ncbi:transcriptional regulator GntR family [Clostridium sp. CAG:58]|jgi:DNA-binding transcriptional regulator YhcF (GntR family)|nr:transcriptional regulator GntR family [Clostridium sp. CAG:58]
MGCKLLLYEYNSCYRKDGEWMILKIDFESEEALYVQLCNQIIRGIATETLHEGDSLPSVRQLADEIGINMHTVNKAYSVLKQEGFLRLDRRRGAVIALDMDKLRAMDEMKDDLALIVARGICRDVGRDQVHALVDELYDEFLGQE